MSDSRAIAMITGALRNLLDKGLAGELGSGNVTTKPPDKARDGNEGPNQVNIFLYQVAINPSWRNTDIPYQRSSERNTEMPHQGSADPRAQPPLALDLYYIITAYSQGNDEITSHRLLGRAMGILYDHPMLSADEISRALPEDDQEEFYPQIERLRITLQPLSLDEISKMWTAFQTPFRISAAYQVSAVLIDSTRHRRAALPVRRALVYALPNRMPSIESIEPQRILSQGKITIIGRNLEGQITRVRFMIDRDHPVFGQIGSIGDNKITATLPQGLLAGVNTVEVVHDLALGDPPQSHRGFTSNSEPFMLLPQIMAAPPSVAQGDVLRLQVNPPVGQRQRVSLLLGERAITVQPLSPTGPDTSQDLEISIPSDIPRGSYLLRLNVDGAESPLIVDENPLSPTVNQYIGPKLEIT
jgi:hypothetical protein